jgi:hypothetical protein
MKWYFVAQWSGIVNAPAGGGVIIENPETLVPPFLVELDQYHLRDVLPCPFDVQLSLEMLKLPTHVKYVHNSNQ